MKFNLTNVAIGTTLAVIVSVLAASGRNESRANYATHVAEILNRRCVGCHRPGEAAPFSLIGYENARKWSPMVLKALEEKRMPPWRADPSVHEYHDENQVAPAEFDTLRNWVENNWPTGNLAEAPPPPPTKGTWELGEPDVVLSESQPTAIDADGPDEYRNFVFETAYPEDRYLRGFDFKPENRRVVHHVVVYFDSRGIAKKIDAEDKDGKPGYLASGGVNPGFIPEEIPYVWAPGATPRFLPSDIGFKLKKGASIIVQVHYHNSGKPETDRSQIGLYFSERKPDRTAQVEIWFDPTLNVPAGKKGHIWEQKWFSDRDSEMLMIMPHMHYLGRNISAELRRPDGSKEKLISVQNWDFRWQLNYAFKKPVSIPKGSEITMRAEYDNTSGNPNNPNRPPKDVFFGPETTDEMFLFAFTLVPAAKNGGAGAAQHPPAFFRPAPRSP